MTWLRKRGLPLLELSGMVAGCIVIVHGDVSSVQARADAHKWEAEARLQMNRIEGKLGDQEATERFLEGVRALSNQLTMEKAGSAADRFFDAESERRRIREDIGRVNQKELLAQQVRVQPVVDYVVSKIDGWIAEISKRGIDVQLEKERAVGVSATQPTTIVIRKATFKNDVTLRLHLNPAILQDGVLRNICLMQLSISTKGHDQDAVWILSMSDNAYDLNNGRPSRLNFKAFSGREINPIQDAKFVSALDQSVDEVVTFALDEATVE